MSHTAVDWFRGGGATNNWWSIHPEEAHHLVLHVLNEHLDQGHRVIIPNDMTGFYSEWTRAHGGQVITLEPGETVNPIRVDLPESVPGAEAMDSSQSAHQVQIISDLVKLERGDWLSYAEHDLLRNILSGLREQGIPESLAAIQNPLRGTVEDMIEKVSQSDPVTKTLLSAMLADFRTTINNLIDDLGELLSPDRRFNLAGADSSPIDLTAKIICYDMSSLADLDQKSRAQAVVSCIGKTGLAVSLLDGARTAGATGQLGAPIAYVTDLSFVDPSVGQTVMNATDVASRMLPRSPIPASSYTVLPYRPEDCDAHASARQRYTKLYEGIVETAGVVATFAGQRGNERRFELQGNATTEKTVVNVSDSGVT